MNHAFYKLMLKDQLSFTPIRYNEFYDEMPTLLLYYFDDDALSKIISINDTYRTYTTKLKTLLETFHDINLFSLLSGLIYLEKISVIFTQIDTKTDIGDLDNVNFIIHIINKDLLAHERGKIAKQIKLNHGITEDFVIQYIRQLTSKNKRLQPISYNKFLEKDLESICKNSLHKIELGMTLIQTQYPIPNSAIDILAEDKNKKKCIIELKITDSCKDIIYQSVYYPTQFDENVRMITICPSYKPNILTSLKSLGNVEIKKYYFQGDNDEIYFENVI